MKSITSLAFCNNKKNKTRSILIIISIFLSTLLLMIIATWGYGIIKSNRVNADKLYGGYDGSYKDVTKQQLSEMNLRNEFAETGSLAYIGMVESDASVNLYWADETALELNNMYDKLQEGAFPQKMGEIAGQKAFFVNLGYKNPKIGDRITLYCRPDKTSKYKPAQFTVSGIIQDNTLIELTNSYVGYVSEEFYNKLVKEELRAYTVYFRLHPSVPITYDNAETVLQELAGKCGIDKRKVSVNTLYIMWARNPGTDTIAVCIMMSALVILFSIVVIYNIFQVGISYKVQEYGKIKALGATRKQLKKLVFREGMMLAAIGIPLGIFAGYLVSIISFRSFMSISDKLIQGSKQEQVSLFCMPVIILVSFFSLVTVWLAIKKPMKIISSLSTVESLRYQEGADIKKAFRKRADNKGYRKGKSEIGVRGMTFANISWNKRRTISTILTMGLSCVLFVTISNIAGNIDEEYEARRSIEYGQFCIMLDYSLNDMAYPEDNLDSILKNNPLSPQLVEKITNIDGVTEVKTRNILAIRIKSDNAEKAGRLMSLSVLDRKDFDKLNHRSVSIGDMDYDTAVKRKAIFYGWSRFFNDSGYELNQMLNINLISAKQSIDFPCPLIGSFGSLDTDWAITEDTFKELNITDNTTGAIWVDCSKKDITEVRSKLHNLLSDITHIEISEYQDAFKITQYSSYIMKIGIYSFLVIIGFIGFLNMANTMITSIITRKKEYGVLQAIGMTNTQLNHMLQTEGFIFTLGTILIALVVGIPAGYMMFIYGKKNSIFGLNIYHIPFVEVGIMITVIALLQIILSYLLSRNIKKESLVERIRYYE